ncbi:hypothetical protein ABZP36_022886 [Zizania latifolia]
MTEYGSAGIVFWPAALASLLARFCTGFHDDDDDGPAGGGDDGGPTPRQMASAAAKHFSSVHKINFS